MNASDIIFYFFLFFQIFVQMTFLLYLLESIEQDSSTVNPIWLPTVSIIVPGFNEQNTIRKTILSLLALEYPKNLLQIIAVDDGSTDATWQVLQEFSQNPRVLLLQKPNEGSKYRALNFGLQHVTGEIVGCLDADSRVDSHALTHSVAQFSDKSVGAVVPTIIIDHPKGFYQRMQKVEYEIGAALRRAFAQMNALYITPGPFSLFRSSILKELNGYAFAHHTEDLDIALRLHQHGWRIVHSRNSFVYTVAPNTFNTLLKQRVRWLTGFLRNMMDYKQMLFAKKHGSLGFFVLPYALFSIVSFLYLAPTSVYQLLQISIWERQIQNFLNFINGAAPALYFSPSMLTVLFSGPFVFLLLFLSIGRTMTGKRLLSLDIVTIVVYPVFAAIWSIKSIADVVFSRKTPWR